MSSATAKLYRFPGQGGRVKPRVEPTEDASHSTHASAQASDQLSPEALVTLQIVVALAATTTDRHPDIRPFASVHEVAATLYTAATIYYQHPEHGAVQIVWTSVEACLRSSYPKLFNRADRGELMSDETFQSATRILRELMFWSGHLEGHMSSPDPLDRCRVVQPRSFAKRCAVRTLVPLWWIALFVWGFFTISARDYDSQGSRRRR